MTHEANWRRAIARRCPSLAVLLVAKPTRRSSAAWLSTAMGSAPLSLLPATRHSSPCRRLIWGNGSSFKKKIKINTGEKGAGIIFRGRTFPRSWSCGGVIPNPPGATGTGERQAGLRGGEGICEAAERCQARR